MYLVALAGYLAPTVRSPGWASPASRLAAPIAVSGAFVALTFLPALLGMLGPRINALSLRGLFVRLGIMSRTRQPGHRWSGSAPRQAYSPQRVVRR